MPTWERDREGNYRLDYPGYDPDYYRDRWENPDKYSVLDIDRPVLRGIGARAISDYSVNGPWREKSRFVDGSEIESKKIFAGYGSEPYRELRAADRLAEAYGGKPNEWSHVAGNGWMFDPIDGRIRKAEIHWMEHGEYGMQEFWWKRWMDN